MNSFLTIEVARAHVNELRREACERQERQERQVALGRRPRFRFGLPRR